MRWLCGDVFQGGCNQEGASMQIEQRRWTETTGWVPATSGALRDSAQLVFVFGATGILREHQLFQDIKQTYPGAHIFGCSTAGEICDTEVTDEALITTAIQFAHTRLQGAQIPLRAVENSMQAGERLAAALEKDGLVHVLVLSDGLKVNGTELVRGLAKHLPRGVAVTGGLAADGARFEQTLVCLDGPPVAETIAVIGFYGTRLHVGYGSLGGWDPFGPERLITHSKGNVLYALDGQSALALYKQYLGEHAANLPASGLLFPLSLRSKAGESVVVRTILAVSEAEQSLTFAGDVPEGAYARLMKANFERLIDGAIGAAQTSCEAIGAGSPELAILISCVGRKLLLKQRTEDEVEGVRDILGEDTIMTGFYSYGEICPAAPLGHCELHNQTMTITTFAER
jgi:hypothetical protein